MLTKCAAVGWAAFAALAAVLTAAMPTTTGAVDQWLFTDNHRNPPVEASSVPLQNPAGGPYFGKLDPAAFAGPRDEPFFVDLAAGSGGLDLGASIRDPEVPM
jgi:hypothetical protein